MPFKRKVIQLCTGDILGRKGKNKPCIYAVIKIVIVHQPLFPSSTESRKVDHLSIWCEKKYRFIRKWITECSYYQNTTLEQHL